MVRSIFRSFAFLSLLLAVLSFTVTIFASEEFAEIADDFEFHFDPKHEGALSAAIPQDYQTSEEIESSPSTGSTSNSMTDALHDEEYIIADLKYLAEIELNSSSHHSMHLMQSTTTWGMERLCASAPWSARIQPGLLFRKRGLSYTQINTGIRVALAPGFLLLFEGGFTGTFNNQPAVENDVWVSNDNGRTWDLVGGRSLFGRSGNITSAHPQGFTPRRGSNNCADPVTDIVLSIAGYTSNDIWTNQVWHSFDGLNWENQGQGRFTPARHFTSCDIDESGHAFVIGGTAMNTTTNQTYFVNDVWQTNALWTFNPWRRITAAAPFSARQEHLVLVGNSTLLKREIIYVMGGKTTCTYRADGSNKNCYDGFNSNDVWASSDAATTWTLITANAPWEPRWGHGGWVTTAGVLLMWGGLNSLSGLYGDTYTQRDIWASYNGGSTWHQCTLPANEGAWFVRGEQSGVVDSRGRLILSSGYAYSENGIQQVRYNDVWTTNWSVENTTNLLARCGGRSALPAGGIIGLRTWPNTGSSSGTITFTPLTRRAPWSPRIQPAFLLMAEPRTYTNPTDGSTATTGPNWLLMYEGSLTTGIRNENDVYASADDGETWTLISGISYQGSFGYRESAHPYSSFDGHGGASNCEDPTNDDVYALGGIIYTNFTSTYGNEVWYSSDAINWKLQVSSSGRSFSPGRYFHSCDVDNNHQIFVIGGQDGATYLNDIWRSNNKGVQWTRVTSRAPFPPRSEHAVQVVYSEMYQTDLIYVMGGFTTPAGGGALNDVWVSSNSAVTWKRLSPTAGATWGKRWGHGAAITQEGVILIMGGTSATYNSYYDLFASFDGGITFKNCKLPVNGGFIRGEQAVALTGDEKLIVGNGYKYDSNGGYRSEYSDLWISDVSFSDAEFITSYCSTQLPEDGVGLLNVNGWDIPPKNGTDPEDGEEKSSSGSSTAMVILIIVGILIVLGVLFWMYRHYQTTGSWNILESAPAKPEIIDTTALFGGHASSTSSEPSSASSTQLAAF